MEQPTNMNSILSPEFLLALKRSIQGELFTPEDDGYEKA